MVKTFDPDKARVQAEATIEAAEARKAKAVTALEPIQARVKKAQEALAKGEEKVQDENALIKRQRDFLQRAYPDLYPVEADSAEVIASTEGQEQVFSDAV